MNMSVGFPHVRTATCNLLVKLHCDADARAVAEAAASSLLDELEPMVASVEAHTCCICSDGACSPAHPAVFTPCFHFFHKACLLQWVQRGSKDSCPICKAPVVATIQKLVDNGVHDGRL